MTDPKQTPEGKAYDSNEDMKAPHEGGSPRPASEPRGSEGSAKGSKTATDPGDRREPNKSKAT